MSLVVDNGREKTRHHRKLKEDNKEVFIKEKEKKGRGDSHKMKIIIHSNGFVTGYSKDSNVLRFDLHER